MEINTNEPFHRVRGRSRLQQKKQRQLGVPIGTASHRLRRMIMFQLVKELGRNVCFRCGAMIELADHLGIDHKIAWLDRGAALFWDPANIAFSHKECNSRSRRTISGRRLGPSALRKVGPEGTAWCGVHRAFLPVSQFGQHRARWNGVQSDCKSCARARSVKRRNSSYVTNPQAARSVRP